MTQATPSVGETLRRLRTRRGISQFDLAVCMGWKGTNPVIQIEKDRRIPRPETLDKLGACLGLSFMEIHYLNGLAGNLLPTRLPPPAQVTAVLDDVAGFIKGVEFPSYVIDYRFRLWMANPATAMLTLGDLDRMAGLMARPLNMLDTIFDSRLGMQADIANLDHMQMGQIFRFKASNAYRQHEPFYQAYPACMQSRLNADDYAVFAGLWEAIGMEQVTSVAAMRLAQFYANSDRGDLQVRGPDGVVDYQILVEPLLPLGELIQVVTLMPLPDPANQARAEAARQTFTPRTGAVLKVWELLPLEQLYG